MHSDFETSWIAEFLGTSVARVDRLSARSGIPRSGKKVGKRHRFSFQDVCRLDLAFVLFRGGLRGPAIRSILGYKHVHNLIGHLSSLQAVRDRAKTAGFLLAAGFSESKKHTYQLFRVARTVNKNIETLDGRVCIAIPLGCWLRLLAKRMEAFTSL
jgi:hypothetical protein